MNHPKLAEHLVPLLYRRAKACRQHMAGLGTEVPQEHLGTQQRVAGAPRRAMHRGGHMGQTSPPASTQPPARFSAGMPPRRVEHAA